MSDILEEEGGNRLREGGGSGITTDTRGNLTGPRDNIVSIFSAQLRGLVESSNRTLADTQRNIPPEDLLAIFLNTGEENRVNLDIVYAGLIEEAHRKLSDMPDSDKAKAFSRGIYAGWFTLGPYGLNVPLGSLAYGDPDATIPPKEYIKPAYDASTSGQEENPGLYATCPFTSSTNRLAAYAKKVFISAAAAGLEVPDYSKGFQMSHYPATDQVVSDIYNRH